MWASILLNCYRGSRYGFAHTQSPKERGVCQRGIGRIETQARSCRKSTDCFTYQQSHSKGGYSSLCNCLVRQTLVVWVNHSLLLSPPHTSLFPPSEKKYLGKDLITAEHHRKIQNGNIKPHSGKTILVQPARTNIGSIFRHRSRWLLVVGQWLFVASPGKDFLNIGSRSHFLHYAVSHLCLKL